MSEDRPTRRYLMNERHAKSLKGKIVEKIEREKDEIKITFSDGTAISLSGDRPQFGRLMVYIWK